MSCVSNILIYPFCYCCFHCCWSSAKKKPGDNALYKLYKCLILYVFLCAPIYSDFLNGSNAVIVGSTGFFSLDNLNGALEMKLKKKQHAFISFLSSMPLEATTPPHAVILVVVVPHIKYEAEIYRPHLKHIYLNECDECVKRDRAEKRIIK